MTRTTSVATDYFTSSRYALVLVLVFGSGCSALIFEVIWYQSLALIIGSSAVSLGVVLATFMGGLCAGSFAAIRWSGRYRHPLKAYAALECLVAASALIVASSSANGSSGSAM